MKPKTLREKFEACYRRMHPDMNPNTDWFERDDIWGKGGYAQPCVHFDWLLYRAGYEQGRKR